MSFTVLALLSSMCAAVFLLPLLLFMQSFLPGGPGRLDAADERVAIRPALQGSRHNLQAAQFVEEPVVARLKFVLRGNLRVGYELDLDFFAHRSSNACNHCSRLSFENRRFPFTRKIGIGCFIRALPRAFDIE